jgi:hypothetical protein
MNDEAKEMLKYYGDQLTRIRRLNKDLEEKVKDLNVARTQRDILFGISFFLLISITMF